ncbi:MAG: copper resistance CopC family protein [Pseudomonadota bacterium]
MKALVLATALMTSLAGPALAHSPVNSSQPADGAALDTVPQTLTLTLAEPGRFMKVEVTYTAVNDSVNNTMELEIPNRDVTGSMEFPAPDMGAGRYLVEWRVLGEDGHALNGTVTYTVQAQ